MGSPKLETHIFTWDEAEVLLAKKVKVCVSFSLISNTSEATVSTVDLEQVNFPLKKEGKLEYISTLGIEAVKILYTKPL